METVYFEAYMIIYDLDLEGKALKEVLYSIEFM